jgi:hypothetical protein
MDEFTPEQRAIFRYDNGAGPVCGDPLKLNRGLVRRLGDPAAIVARINGISAAGDDMEAILNGIEATEALVEGIRDVFQMAPLDPATGAGATDAMVLGVANAFFTHFGSGRTTTDPPPTSSLPTASIHEIPNSMAG